MDFQKLKRRDLQALSKLNNVPANLTNAAMADSLRSLDTVKGIEDLLEQSETRAIESSQIYAINSPYISQTSTCNTIKTATATRTTRRRATQEASIQLEMDKDMQAKFEEDLEQPDITTDSGVELTETSDEVSVVSVNNDGKDHVVNEALDESVEISTGVQKLDFHCLGRKDLQNLCKKNKIPANMTNAAMADALWSLDSVEGLEELLEGYDPVAIKSPETSRMTSSQVRPPRTAQKTTGKKSARAGSALFKSMGRKVEDLNEENQELPLSMNSNEGGMSVEMEDLNEENQECPLSMNTIEEGVSVEMDENQQSHVDEGYGSTKPVSEEEALNEHNTSTETLVTNNQSIVVLAEEFSNLLKNEVKLQEDASENASTDQEEANVNISVASSMAELMMTDKDCSSEPKIDECLMLEAPEADINEVDMSTEHSDTSADIQTQESEAYALMHEDAPAVLIEGFADSRELSDFEADGEDFEFANEDVIAEEDSDVVEGISSLLHINVPLKPEEYCGIEDEHVACDCASEVSLVSEPEDNNVESCISVKFVSETATQRVLKGKATPLCRKSLRKLKKLVKEKLQETNLLATKMENLTLHESEIRVDVGKGLGEGSDETSDELNSSTLSVSSDNDEEENESFEMKAKDVGKVLSEEPIELPATRNAPKSFVNKENIHDSATEMTATPLMSIAKLKKEVKVLLELSEKKRPALQSRSDNQCCLTSP